jgi:ribonuclease Z
MDMDLVFLGTGGSVPTARRSTACLLARVGGDRLLFDCGEGSQRQMQRSTGLVQVDAIFVTHLHADHYLGIPGLLKTYDLNDRERPLRVYGPRGLIDLFVALRRVFGRIGYEVELTELEPDEAVRFDGYEVRPFDVVHRMKAFGYALVEDSRPGRFDAELATRLGVTPGPDFGRLQAGETVGGVRPEQVIGPPRAGRRIVMSGDTAPCQAVEVYAHRADLLVHEATFTDEERDRARQTAHTTARQAAEIARDAEVKLLALTHLSTRHFPREIRDEARAAFPGAVVPRDFDSVVLPFPEKGEPELVKGGAGAGEPAPAQA